jgi:hypothetical protein
MGGAWEVGESSGKSDLTDQVGWASMASMSSGVFAADEEELRGSSDTFKTLGSSRQLRAA